MKVVEHLDFPALTISLPIGMQRFHTAKAAAEKKRWIVREHSTPTGTMYMSSDVYSAFAEDHPDLDHQQFSERN